MFDRPTIAGLRKNKGTRQIITMHVDSAAEAAAALEAGIEMFTCEVDETLPGIRAAAPVSSFRPRTRRARSTTNRAPFARASPPSRRARMRSISRAR